MFYYDIDKHNEEYEAFCAARDAGRQPRIEMTVGCNPRMILMDDALNPEGYTFEQYFNDPAVMLEVQCRFFEYCLNYLAWDKRMGIGPETVFNLYPDFQNVLEPAWYGCPIAYNGRGEPSTRKLLNEDNKNMLFKKGMLDPFGGIMEKCFEINAFFAKKAAEGFTWNGAPVAAVTNNDVAAATDSPPAATLINPAATPAVNVPVAAANSFFAGTDGPMTVACSLMGATEFCVALYEDTGYALELLDYITENSINRVRALRRHFGLDESPGEMGLADDSIAMLSESDYIRLILPFHKKLKSALSAEGSRCMVHLCGDAERHFKTIRRELNAARFDTGYPINLGRAVRELGPDVTVLGGVKVQTLLHGSAAEVRAEAKRILGEVLPCKNFIMRDANNLSPRTPPENLAAMYETVKEWGRIK